MILTPTRPLTSEALEAEGLGLPEVWALLIGGGELTASWYERKPFAFEVRWDLPGRLIRREYAVDGAALLDGHGREVEHWEFGKVRLWSGDSLTLIYELSAADA